MQGILLALHRIIWLDNRLDGFSTCHLFIAGMQELPQMCSSMTPGIKFTGQIVIQASIYKLMHLYQRLTAHSVH